MQAELVGWTTRGRVASRTGANADTTHQRYRHYRADSIHTVALTMADEESPSVEDAAQAINEPARPLFIGRKTCLPAAPILLGMIDASSLFDALSLIPRARRAHAGRLRASWWIDEHEPPLEDVQTVAVTDERDWRNAVHVGRRLMREGFIDPPEVARV